MPPKKKPQTAKAKGAKRTVKPVAQKTKKKNAATGVRRSGRQAGLPAPNLQLPRTRGTRTTVSVTPQDAPALAELAQAAAQVQKNPRDNCALTRFVRIASLIKGHARTVLGRVAGKKALLELGKVALLRRYPFLAVCYKWSRENQATIYTAAGTVLTPLLTTEMGQMVLSAAVIGTARGTWRAAPKMVSSFQTGFQSTYNAKPNVLQNLFTAHGSKFGVTV
jgi:hypothetical protein